MLLTNTQASRIHKAFTNGSSANVKFAKTMMYMMVELEWPILEAFGIPDPLNNIKSLLTTMSEP